MEFKIGALFYFDVPGNWDESDWDNASTEERASECVRWDPFYAGIDLDDRVGDALVSEIDPFLGSYINNEMTAQDVLDLAAKEPSCEDIKQPYCPLDYENIITFGVTPDELFATEHLYEDTDAEGRVQQVMFAV